MNRYMLMVALAIRWTDPGPVIFGHERIGLNGRRFKCLKFRSMIVNSEAVLRELLDNDAAVISALRAALGEAMGRDAASPQYCDACFSGQYPISPSDKIEEGFQMKAAE